MSSQNRTHWPKATRKSSQQTSYATLTSFSTLNYRCHCNTLPRLHPSVSTFLPRICRLRLIRRRIGQNVTTRVVLGMITTKLDYCNSLLAGLPNSTREPLRRAQSCTARLISIYGHRDHVVQSDWQAVCRQVARRNRAMPTFVQYTKKKRLNLEKNSWKE